MTKPTLKHKLLETLEASVEQKSNRFENAVSDVGSTDEKVSAIGLEAGISGQARG